MSITETTESPQHKPHWLAEQALSWSGLPVVAVRPTVLLEGFFLLLAAVSVREADKLALPMGAGKTSPVSSLDDARAVAAILDDPAPHIGHIYDLTVPESADLDHYARVFSEALARMIRYRDAPTSEWSETSGGGPVGACRPPPHGDDRTPQAGRYGGMSEDGEAPTSMADFVMPRNSRGRYALVRDREVSMRKLRFSERQTAFILTKAAAACPRGGTTCCPIVPEAPGLASYRPSDGLMSILD